MTSTYGAGYLARAESKVKSPDRKEVEDLIDEINDYSRSLKQTDLFTGDVPNRERYEQISFRISSILPKISDPSVYEIDDIILPTFNHLTVDSSRSFPNQDLSMLIEASLKLHSCLYCFESYCDPTFVVPLTELVELTRWRKCLRSATGHALRLMGTWKVKNACLGLRLMKVLIKKANMGFSGVDDILPPGFVRWLSTLRNIPQPKCPEKQRIASWMRRQHQTILDFLNRGKRNGGIGCFTGWKLDPPLHLVDMLGSHRHYPVQLDHLYSYFMSSDDESQRLKLLESFVRGCLEKCHRDGPLRRVKIPQNIAFLGYMYDLVEQFCEYFSVVAIQSDPEGRWIEFEKCLDGYKREPYLSERSGGSTGVRIWDEQPLNVDFKRPSNSESPSEDLTIEKHVFFDMFLNRLELMNILRTAFWKTAEILEMEAFPEGYESMVFWMHNSKFSTRRVISEFLSEPEAGSKSWKWFKFTLKMCPFLYLPRGCEHFADDLLKVARGEKIDQATLDELYFAVNNVPDFRYYPTK